MEPNMSMQLTDAALWRGMKLVIAALVTPITCAPGAPSLLVKPGSGVILSGDC